MAWGDWKGCACNLPSRFPSPLGASYALAIWRMRPSSKNLTPDPSPFRWTGVDQPELEIPPQAPQTARCFIRTGDLEGAAFIEEVADDLEADGEAFAEAAGDAN